MTAKSRLGLTTLAIICGIGATIFMSASDASPQRCEKQGADGGPCTYQIYPGKATITRIQRTPASVGQSLIIGGPGYAGLEVWFKCMPSGETWPSGLASLMDKEYAFTLNNSWYVGPKYLMKYHVVPGTELPCEISVLESGVCSPVVVRIIPLDASDYFEAVSP